MCTASAYVLTHVPAYPPSSLPLNNPGLPQEEHLSGSAGFRLAPPPGCQQSGAPPALSGSSAAVSPPSAGRMMFAQSGLPGETGIIVRLLAWGM